MSEANAVTRRALCIGVGTTVVLAGLGAFRYAGSQPLVRPPGGQDEDGLVSKCVHCYKCIEACPERVIVPASIEAGILNMRTPRLEFSDCYPGQLDDFRYCDLCVGRNGGVPLCADACPSDALQLGSGWSSDEAVLGVAVLDTSLCIAYRSSYCAFCYDACRQVRGDDKAAIFYQNSDASGAVETRLPAVNAAKCNGCGACEAVCVSAQAGSTLNASQRAISVRPLSEMEGRS